MVCSDKTGTLTENCMEVTRLYTSSCCLANLGRQEDASEGYNVLPNTHPDVVKVIEVRSSLVYACMIFCVH